MKTGQEVPAIKSLTEVEGKIMATVTKMKTKDFQMPNKFGTSCTICGDHVPERKGLSGKTLKDQWFTVCNTRQCIEAADLTVPGQETRELRVDETNDSRLVVDTPYEKQNLSLVKSFPDAQFDGDRKVWMVSADMADRPRVLELADKLELDVADELREISFGEDIEDIVENADESGAYDYQLDGVRHLATRDNALLADDMGLGKTCQTIWALPEDAKVLVVCPNSARGVWKAEVAKWRSSYDVILPQTRDEVHPPQKGEIVVINYAKLPGSLESEWSKNDYDSNGVELDSKWNQVEVLVADEAHAFKNREADRTRRFNELREHADKCWGLTGTPLSNRPFDLWGTLSSLGLNWDVFGGWNKFLDLFNGHKNRWGGYEFGQPDPEVSERLKRVMLRRLKDDVLSDLPDKTRQVIEIGSLPDHLIDRLDDLEDEYEETFNDGRLPPFEEFSVVRRQLTEARIPHALEIANEYEETEKPLVVFSAHRKPIEEFGKRDGWECIHGDISSTQRSKTVEAFQNGKLKGLALTIGAGKEALTLTAADTVLFIDQSWVPGDNRQAEDRIRRIGQYSDKCHYKILVSSHSLDQRIVELLKWKTEVIDTTVDGEVEGTGQPETEIDIKEAGDNWADKVAKQEEKRKKKAVSDETREQVIAQMKFMLRRCDGARRDDDVGFNAYDARKARHLRPKLEVSDGAVRYAKKMLHKYRGQLKSGGLWDEDTNETDI